MEINCQQTLHNLTVNTCFKVWFLQEDLLTLPSWTAHLFPDEPHTQQAGTCITKSHTQPQKSLRIPKNLVNGTAATTNALMGLHSAQYPFFCLVHPCHIQAIPSDGKVFFFIVSWPVQNTLGLLLAREQSPSNVLTSPSLSPWVAQF